MIDITTIYIDVLFLVNLSINTSLILCLGYILRLPLKAVRILLGAIVGAVYSCLAFTGDFDNLASLAIRVLFAVLIVITAFGISGIISVIKRTVLFVALTVAMGVVMLAVLYFSRLGIRLGGVIKNGVFYFDIPTHYMLLCSLASYVVILALEKLFKRSAKRSYSRIKLYRLGKTVELTALVDTGNMLCDPFTGRKVIIAEAKILSPLFSFDIDTILTDNPCGDNLPEGFRLIPYSSIGKKDGLLAAFVPDAVEIDHKKADNVITAVFDGVLSGSGDYNALIGPNV